MRDARPEQGPPGEFPAFRIGLPLLLAMVALGGGGQWLLDRNQEERTLSAAFSPFAVTPVPATSPLHLAIIEHTENVEPILLDIARGQTERDLDTLAEAHLLLLETIDAAPGPGAGTDLDDRNLYLAYQGVLAAIEDGVDDLIEGLRDDNEMEWNEGVRELGLARAKLAAFLDR